jgi:phytoene/squalene synthetase
VATTAFRALMAFEVRRARDLLDRGAPLVGALRGRPGLAVAGFVGGGRAALRAIEGGGFDVLGARPRPSTTRRLAALMGAARASGWRP